MSGSILQQSVGLPAVHDPDGKPWTSAIVKRPAQRTLQLSPTNLEGDGQADLRHHGGHDKSVLAYPAAHYDAWRPGLDLRPGDFGENWTVTHQTEETVCLGDIYEVGTARVQISQPRQPCWKLSRLWNRPDLAKRAQDNGRLGWYFRVLQPGAVTVGDTLQRLKRPLPHWTIARLNALMHHDRTNLDDAAALAACDLLANSWRITFKNRLDRHPPPDPDPRLNGD